MLINFIQIAKYLLGSSFIFSSLYVFPKILSNVENFGQAKVKDLDVGNIDLLKSKNKIKKLLKNEKNENKLNSLNLTSFENENFNLFTYEEFLKTSSTNKFNVTPTLLTSSAKYKEYNYGHEFFQAHNKDQFSYITKGLRELYLYETKQIPDKSVSEAGKYFYDRFFPDDDTVTQRSNFYSSLIYGLLEWSKNQNFIVKSDINLLVNIGDFADQWGDYHIPLTNLNFSFTIKNSKKFLLFDQFLIPEAGEWKINIKLNAGKIKHIIKHKGAYNVAQSSYAILPIESDQFICNIQKIDEFLNDNENNRGGGSIVYYSNDIRFIYNVPPNFKFCLEESCSSDYLKKVLINSVSFEDIDELTKPYLTDSNIMTTENIKADIDNWYGAYPFSVLSMQLGDLEELNKYLRNNFFTSDDGRKINIFEKLTTDNNFVNNLFSKYNLNSWQMLLINNLVNQLKQTENTKNQGEDTFINQLLNFLIGFMHSYKKLLNNLEINIKWDKEPVVTQEKDKKFKVSFKFNQEWKIIKETKFFFKGELQPNGTPTKQDPSSNNPKFDINKLLLDPTKLFNNIAKVMYGNDAINKLLPNILNNLKDFIGWNVLVFEKDQKITNTYTADETDVVVSAIESSDYGNYRLGPSILGYKFIDVKAEYNLYGFWSIFAQLFNKIQCYKDPSKKQFDATGLISKSGEIIGKIKNNPIKEVVHIINSLLGVGYGTDTSKDKLDGCENSNTDGDKNWKLVDKNKSDQHPWNIFFETLFRKSFTIISKQVFVGYPKAFFSYNNQYKIKLKELMGTSSEGQYKLWNNEKLNEKLSTQSFESFYPITYKSITLERAMKKLQFNMGMSFPDKPLIYELSDHNMLNFYKKMNETFEDDKQLLTSLIHEKDKLNKMVYEFFKSSKNNRLNYYAENETSPFVQLDPSKLKITVLSLDVKSAVESMLQSNLSNLPSVVKLAVTVPTLFSKAIDREFYVLYINTMQPHGIWNFLKLDNIRRATYSSFSEIIMPVPLSFKPCKMNSTIITKALNCPK